MYPSAGIYVVFRKYKLLELLEYQNVTQNDIKKNYITKNVLYSSTFFQHLNIIIRIIMLSEIAFYSQNYLTLSVERQGIQENIYPEFCLLFEPWFSHFKK